MTELFELNFVDGSKLIGAEQNGNAVYTTVCGGLADMFKQVFNKKEYRYICAFAYELSKNHQYICGYRDLVAENSDKIESELLNKNK